MYSRYLAYILFTMNVQAVQIINSYAAHTKCLTFPRGSRSVDILKSILFIYVFFNNAVNKADYVAPNFQVIYT